MRRSLAVLFAACLLVTFAACGKKDIGDITGLWNVDLDRTLEVIKKTPRYLQLPDDQKKQVPAVLEKLTAQSHMEITKDAIIISLGERKAPTPFTLAKKEKNALVLDAKVHGDKIFHITVNFLTPDIIQFTCPEAPDLANNVWKRG